MEMTTTTTTRTSVSESMLRNAIDPHTTRLNSREAGYWHSDGSHWDIKTDSSCGWEVASPALLLDSYGDNEELKGVCGGLTLIRPVVNRSCGLHVHVDVSDFSWRDVQRVVALWARYEPFFFELMPLARRNNQFCHAMNREAWTSPASHHFATTRQILDANSETTFDRHARQFGRYASLNLASWWRNRRLEFRLHSGTINYVKVKNWTMLCNAVVGRVVHPTLPEVSRVIRQERRASGFSTVYIGRQLGMLQSRQVPDPPPEGGDLMAWINSRRLQFTPESANYGGPAPTAASTPTR